jgi:hypothetical protein
MIRNIKKLDEFFKELTAREKISYEQAVIIYDTLHQEAVALGAISHENIWEGFEIDLRIAGAINKIGNDNKTDQKNISTTGR